MRRLCVVIWLTLLLGGCGGLRSGGYYESDGPPRFKRVDVSRVADATPRHEPLSDTGNDPYTINGRTYYPIRNSDGYRERGVASWYGRMFHGRRTSSGEPYNMYAMTAAHRTLPLPSYARVRNLQNGRQVVVRINDRGPFLHNRLVDLSYAAAFKLGITGTGTGLVEVSAVRPEGRKFESAALPAPVVDTHTASPSIYVQLGAFAQRENAERMRRLLRAHTHGPVILQQTRSPYSEIHRVRVGPIASVEEADRIIENMQRQGFDPKLVVE